MWPSHFGPNHFSVRVEDPSVPCRADVERRATGVDDEHVETVRQWLHRGVREPGDGRECRSGVDAVQRLLAHLVEPHDASGEVSRVPWLTAEAELSESVVDLVQVRVDQRLERDVDDGRRCSPVLVDDGVERVAHRDLDIGELGAEELTDPKLVHGIHDRPQQAHAHGLDVELPQSRQHAVDARTIEGRADGAVGQDPLVHGEGE